MMDPVRNDWTLSLTYNETRNQNGTIHRWDSYLSVPELSKAKSCTFMFAGLNKTSSSSRRQGCDGVIDDMCISVLREIEYLGGDCTWPTPVNVFTERLRQACGSDILTAGSQPSRKYLMVFQSSRSQLITITVPVKFGNSTLHCDQAHPPGGNSPEEYTSFQVASMYTEWDDQHSDRNTSDYTWYDIYARQSIPIVVAARFYGGVTETQVVCLRPNDVAEGSRTPMKSSAAGASWRTMRALGTPVVLIFVVTMLT